MNLSLGPLIYIYMYDQIDTRPNTLLVQLSRASLAFQNDVYNIHKKEHGRVLVDLVVYLCTEGWSWCTSKVHGRVLVSLLVYLCTEGSFEVHEQGTRACTF